MAPSKLTMKLPKL